jgi:hypothetical protein
MMRAGSTPGERTNPLRVTRRMAGGCTAGAWFFLCHAQAAPAFTLAMADFIRAGGYPIWIVIALTVPTLILAIRFVVAVDARKLAMLRALSWAQVFAVTSGVAANVLAVLWNVGRDEDALKDPLPYLLVGLGEALTPAVLGLSALTVTWILITFGLRRSPRSELEA